MDGLPPSSEISDPADRGPVDAVERVADGAPAGAEELFPLVYDELRRIASRQMAGQRAEHTLGPTALVHEAYVKLCADGAAELRDRDHFLSLAARVMRQVLVDHARRKQAHKRRPPEDGDRFDELVEDFDRRAGGLLDLHDVLERLGARRPELVRLVELRFFAGLPLREVATRFGISERTAARRWEAVRLVLRRELER